MDKYVAPAPSMEKNILIVRASHMGGISQWRGIAGLVGSADHQMMEFLRGARRGTASLAHGLSGPPTGGISNHPGLGTGHRWHTGAADHQLVGLMEPGLRGAAKFWG